MLGKQVDGIVFLGGNITEKHVEEFDRSPVPIVLAGSIDTSGKTPSVNIDYRQAAFDAVTYFIEKGHKHIAYVIGPEHDIINQTQKLVGYREALEKAGIPYRSEYVIEGDYTYDSGLEAWKKLSELSERPTAILAGDDEMALGTMHGAQDEGVSIPTDIEVITSDNTRLAMMGRPQLSSIVQPLYDIGAVAMRLLTKFMNKEKVDEHIVVLPHRIELRGSTK